MPAFTTNPTFVAIPNPAQPVRQQPQQQAAPAQPQAPPDPFKIRPGPGILILPYQPDERPSRQSRVRFNRETVGRLWAQIQADPDNTAHWQAIGDAFEEAGKPAHAELMRHMAHKVTRPLKDRSTRETKAAAHWVRLENNTEAFADSWSDPFAHGQTLGIPIMAYPFFDLHQDFRASNPQHLTRWGIYIGHDPVARTRTGSTFVTPDLGKRLVGEMDEDAYTPEAAAFPQSRPLEEVRSWLAGPRRFNRETIQQLFRQVVADPHDDARWHALGDAFEEAGKPAMAELSRRLAGAEKRFVGPSFPFRSYYDPDDRQKIPTSAKLRVAGIPVMFDAGHGFSFGHHDYINRHSVGEGSLGETLRTAILAEQDRPEQFAAARAPKGGFITRGIYGKAGEFLPAEATAPQPVAQPAPPRRSVRDRMRHIVRTRNEKNGTPIRLEPEKMARKKKAVAPIDPHGPVDLPGLEFVTDPNRLAMIQEIARRPNDPGTRLAMADWLEERGETHAADKVRWYEHAKADVLHHTKLTLGARTPTYDHLHAATTKLMGGPGHDATVLAGTMVHRISRELYPINWDAIRPHHKDPDALRRQIDGAHLAAELIATGIMPRGSALAARDSALAARDSAWAAHGSAWAARGSAWAARNLAAAAHDSAGAAHDSAGAAHGSARAAGGSAWAAHGSARAAHGSAWAARNHIYKIAHAVMTHPHWQTFPREGG